MEKISSATQDRNRVVVKQKSSECSGATRLNLTRYAIGIVLNGEKYLQHDDRVTKIGKGEMFFLNYGQHIIEDWPSESAPFEQIIFYYTSEQLLRAIARFGEESGIIDSDRIEARKMRCESVACATPSKVIRNFFTSVSSLYDCRCFVSDEMCESLKLVELAHYIIKYERGVMLRCFLSSLDCERARFERVIFNNIFVNKSIADLALDANRSVTAFKKEFNICFGISTHQWYQRERLRYARLLLCTTTYTIAEIGGKCQFTNASHFIKIFKRHYDLTPLAYREKNSATNNAEVSGENSLKNAYRDEDK